MSQGHTSNHQKYQVCNCTICIECIIQSCTLYSYALCTLYNHVHCTVMPYAHYTIMYIVQLCLMHIITLCNNKYCCIIQITQDIDFNIEETDVDQAHERGPKDKDVGISIKSLFKQFNVSQS